MKNNVFKRKPYYIGFERRICGFGILLDVNPPFAIKEYSWTFELRLLWFKFWYIKEK